MKITRGQRLDVYDLVVVVVVVLAMRNGLIVKGRSQSWKPDFLWDRGPPAEVRHIALRPAEE